MTAVPDNLAPLLDDKGFLADWQVWTPELAGALAALEGITLGDEHWEILHLLREFYAQFDDSPANRALVKWVRQQRGPDKGNSLYLLTLFPGSPARVGSRIAGLPKPKNCL